MWVAARYKWEQLKKHHRLNRGNYTLKYDASNPQEEANENTTAAQAQGETLGSTLRGFLRASSINRKKLRVSSKKCSYR